MEQGATISRERSTARTHLGILALIFLYSSMVVSYVLAQETTTITPTTGIGSLGTAVTTNDHSVQISGGMRRGENLFHSFKQFDVGHGDTAQFLNNTTSLHTANILSRVTGGHPSVIFGTIDTTSYPGANLFLMNPAGIVFGPNATLNVNGSVAFTTANYLRLAEANGSNAGIFHADPTATSLLNSAPVTAFGFLNSNPAAIAVHESKLMVQPSQSIFLIGGNVTIQVAKLGNNADPLPSVPGKQVFIGSVASPGEMLAGTLDPAPNINSQSPETLGTVNITRGSTIDTRGEGGGTIVIRGGRLIIEEESIIGSNTGDIQLAADSILVKSKARIVTFTTTRADAGHITLNASGNIDLDSAEVTSITDTSSGRAGNITFASSHETVSIVNSSVNSQATSGSGNTGHIQIGARHGDVLLDNSFIFTSSQGTGTPGGIQIAANNLSLKNEAAILRNNFTKRVGESVEIALEGRLSLTGRSAIETITPVSSDAASLTIGSRDILITNDSHLETSTISSGDAGRLSLFTDHLQLTDGGKLSSRSHIDTNLKEIPSGRGGVISIEGFKDPRTAVLIDGSESGIFASAEGTGAGGDISVKASSVTLQNGGQISAETSGISSTATGGSIAINATDQVTMTNGASITASSEVDPKTPNSGIANAGNISVDAGQQLDIQDSSITTEANVASGGNINIKAIDLIRVANGQISSSVQGGPSTSGGNITIDPKTVVLQNAQILASAEQGNGGNIEITTPLFLKDPTSIVDASSRFGLSGTVTVQSPTSNLSGTVGQLTSKTNPPQVLLQNRCIALAGGEQSTFLLSGRDALPTEPGGWLSSPVAMDHWTGEETGEHVSRLMVQSRGWNTQPLLVTAKNEPTVLSLRRLTPPGFLVRSFATGSTGCPS